MRYVWLVALLSVGCGSKFTTNATPIPSQSCIPAGVVVFDPSKPPELVGGFCR